MAAAKWMQRLSAGRLPRTTPFFSTVPRLCPRYAPSRGCCFSARPGWDRLRKVLDGKERELEVLHKELAAVKERTVYQRGDARHPPESPPAPVPPPPAEDWMGLATGVVYVSLWAILGTLTRCGLEELFQTVLATVAAPQMKGIAAALFIDLPANVVGSFVMGLCCGLEKPLARHKTWLLLGVTSGFCGSCTTFSAWMTSAAYTMWGPPTVDASTVFQGLNCLFLGLTTAWASLCLGWRLGDTMALKFSSCAAKPPLDQGTVLAIGAGLLLAVEVGLGVGYVSATAFGARSLLLALVGAPAGALLRYLLSRYNPRWPRFPLFTFLVNVGGTAVSCVLLVLLWSDATTPAIVASEHGREVLTALSISFTGNLSTVSTFVKEMRVLDLLHVKYAAAYAAATLLAAQLVCAVILPPFFAAVGKC